jgi:uncharacterized protein YukE
MPYRSVQVRVKKEFVPAEAHAIAARLRTIAARVRLTADKLRRSLGVLDADWEGCAKTRFVDAAQHDPGNLEAAAAQADDAAHRVENLTVTVWESEVQKVWVDEPPRPGPMAD